MSISLVASPTDEGRGWSAPSVSTKTDRWDVFGRYLWTRSDTKLPLGSAQKIREDAWLLGSSYEHHFDEATLDLKLTAGQHGYNYYGLDLTRPLLGVPLGSIAFGPELRRRSTLVSVGARYAPRRTSRRTGSMTSALG